MNEPDRFSIAIVRIFLLNGGRPHESQSSQKGNLEGSVRSRGGDGLAWRDARPH